MEVGDDVGGVINDVGQGASLVAADPPSSASGGVAAAAGGGGDVDDSPVLELGDGVPAPAQMLHSENGTPVTVNIVPVAPGRSAKRSWIWQVMHEFSPAIKGKNVFCTDHNIRTLDQPYDGGEVSKEQMTIDDLSGEAQLVRSVLLSKLAKKELGEARMPVERICALLDPRRNDCSAEHFINGSDSLKTFAMTDVKNVPKTFVEVGVGQASSAVGGGDGGGGGSNPPAPKRQKGGSDLEERRRKRLAKAKASNASSSASAETATRRSTIIERELRMYVAETTHPEEDDFSLLQFWLRRSKASTCAETGQVEAGLPYLALFARIYNGIESTSCQAERNFSALAFLVGTLRSSMSPGKVERLMFLRLNKLFIPEVKALHDAVEANKAAAARCKEKVAQVTAGAAITPAVLNLRYEAVVL